MAKEAWDTLVAYKLVWIRVLGYFAVPAWLMWETVAKDITGPIWEMMHGFDKFMLIGKCVAAGVIAFLAFIDQSMNRTKAEIELRRRQNLNTGP